MEESEDNLNGWTKKINEYAYNIKSKCNGYKWMHSRMSEICRKRSQWISGVVFLLGAITSTGIFSTIFYCSEALAVQVITGVISVITTFLVLLQVKLDYAGLARDHHSASSKWGKIARDLDIQLRLSTEDREDGKTYIAWVNRIYDTLIDNSPNINTTIFEQYRKKFPEEYTSLQNSARDSLPKETDAKNIDYRYRYEIDRFLVDNIV